MIHLDITPVPKPRQTRADKWQKRPSVLRYRAFADELRYLLRRDFDFNGCGITFIMPMPKSWSKTRKQHTAGLPHTQTPDLDNLLKALLDAHMGDDSSVHKLSYVEKIWGPDGSIQIQD